jgi:hypothetical protein
VFGLEFPPSGVSPFSLSRFRARYARAAQVLEQNLRLRVPVKGVPQMAQVPVTIARFEARHLPHSLLMRCSSMASF